MEDLMAEILSEMVIELELNVEDEEDEKSLKILEIKLKNAIRDIKNAFNFKPYHTDEFVLEEMSKHIGNIKDLTLYDFAHVGIEGETAHQEKNVQRTYKTRESCFNGIVRFAD